MKKNGEKEEKKEHIEGEFMQDKLFLCVHLMCAKREKEKRRDINS